MNKTEVVAHEFDSNEMVCPDCLVEYYADESASALPVTHQDLHDVQDEKYISCIGCGYPLDPCYQTDHGFWDPKPKRKSA